MRTALVSVLVVLLALVSGPLLRSQSRGRQAPPDLGPLAAALDADGNGEISGSEIQRASGALKSLDRNGDGKLSGGELRRPRPSSPPRGRAARERDRVAEAPRLERAPTAKDDAEKKILAVLDDLNRNQRRGNMNVPEDDGRLLRILAETVGAKRVVEIGTSNGYSGIWFSLALRKTGGELITHEIDAGRAALARENYKRAGVDGLITLVFGDAHETVKKLKGPIDILFIDADKPGYPDYLHKLLPLVRPGGLIIGHNMHRPAPSPEYVEAITTNPELETIFLHMDAAGVGLTIKKR